MGSGRSKIEVSENLFPSQFTVFWDDIDIQEWQEEEYLQELRKRKTSVTLYAKELLFACKQNYLFRLSALCRYFVWEMNYPLHCDKLRGDHGETVLQAAIGFRLNEAAKMVIDFGGKDLVLATYSHAHYRGGSALHLAVVIQDVDMVTEMFRNLNQDEKNNFIHTQSTGEFFTETLKLYALPLFLTVWCGNKVMFELLMEHGADLDVTDSKTGDTILHAMVNYGKYHSLDMACEMVNAILHTEVSQKWWAKKINKPFNLLTQQDLFNMRCHLLWKKDHKGFTPLTLAAKLNLEPIYEMLMHTEGVYRITKWQFGPRSMALYDVSEIDTTFASYKRPSLLDLIVHVKEKEGIVPDLQVEPVKSILKNKWKVYRMPFLLWGLYHFTLMVMFTSEVLEFSASEGQGDCLFTIFCDNITHIEEYAEDPHLMFKILLIVMTITAFVYLFFELYDYVYSLNMIFHTKVWKYKFYNPPYSVVLHTDEFRFVFLLFATTTLTWCYLVLFNYLHTDEFLNKVGITMLSLTLITGWYILLYFARTIYLVSYFTVMVHRLWMGDMVRFSLLFAITLFAFGSAQYVLFDHRNGADIPKEMSNFWATIYTLFKLMLGLHDFAITSQSITPAVSTILFVLFVLISAVELLNLLIAVMTDSYAKFADQKDELCVLYRSKVILLMERRLPFLKMFLNKPKTNSVLVQGCRYNRKFIYVEDFQLNAAARKQDMM